MRTRPLDRVMLLALAPAFAAFARPAVAQEAGRVPTIAEKTAGWQSIDGFFPLHWDAAGGRLWMEIPRLDTEVLYITGLAAGLGSNDIGLDRGQLHDSRIVYFERTGPKVMMVQPNYDFRASSTNPLEVRAVRDAFARSVLWGFTVGAESDGRVLVDATDFLVRDASNMAQRLRPGSYRLDVSRSSVYLPMTMGFPQNTEMEAELTFVRQPDAGTRGGGWFEGVGSVSANAEAVSLRLHHSFVALPEPGYQTRVFDPRSGYFAFGYLDYATPIDEQMTHRFIQRHRLAKRDPRAAVSDAVKPIIYYLDPGTPEPVRSALLDGARWWNQAFEAAGYRDAFRVEMLPDSVSPLDVRFNVINWVHRSTRGWSYGSSVSDPRTGEIIKGVVTLGSLRARQDYLIAEGLLSPYETGDERPAEMREWALARIRQLSAHEVGHTLGLGHNYYDSEGGRISVMDYPHPLVTLRADSSFDFSEVYASGIGEWDEVAIAYGYQDFAPGTDERAALAALLDSAWTRDLRYLSNQDVDLNPKVDQWSNGVDASAELRRMMEVRAVALSRFGERAIRRGQPLAQMEEALVPLYLHHRYQVEAAASALGGQHYIYAMRGDGRDPVRWAPAAEQRAALGALLATVTPAVLALPRGILDRLPPRPPGYRMSRELFPRYTGSAFDAISPAIVASRHTLSTILTPQRTARMVEQHALEPSLPSFGEVLDSLSSATFGSAARTPYEAEVRRAVQRVLVEQMIALADGAPMPQVRAIAADRLTSRMVALRRPGATGDERAHRALLASDIQRFLERPATTADAPQLPEAPPGAPIGDPSLDWLMRLEPPCTLWQARHWH
ncbi:MAG TPA: zinc-dependent metalloprotease [Gemmatimonadaceae bacterium]|nr:zinc-dependent metalloprotease [Gemmatimonadaceae bacterium]